MAIAAAIRIAMSVERGRARVSSANIGTQPAWATMPTGRSDDAAMRGGA
jgi:hypothetical protein